MPNARNRKAKADRFPNKPDLPQDDQQQEEIIDPTVPISGFASTVPGHDQEDITLMEINAALLDKGAPPPEAPPGFKSAGTLLREARTAQGLTIESVSAQIKLAPRQVEALENDDYEALPMQTFVRGFTRNYARLLRLDPEVVVAALPQPGQSAASPAALSVQTPTARMTELPDDDVSFSNSRKPWAWIIGIIVILAALVTLSFSSTVQQWFRDFANPIHLMQGDEASEPADTPLMPSDLPTPLEPIPPHTQPTLPNSSAPAISVLSQDGEAPEPNSKEVASLDHVDLLVICDGESWIEIYDGKGQPRITEMCQAGAQINFNGLAPLSLTLGKSQNVRLVYRGTPLDPRTYRRAGGLSRFKLSANSVAFE